MQRGIILGIVAMAAVVVVSNILVQFLLGQWLTWGALTYPIAYLITDLVNRIYGQAEARRVVVFGFIVGIVCSLIGSQIEGEYGPLVTLRVAVASGTAFLVAQLIDVFVFERLRDGAWWRAPLTSSAVGSTVDTALFFPIAFSAALIWMEPSNDVSWAGEILPILGLGPAAPLWVSLALADWLVKIAIALIALIPFRVLVARWTMASVRPH